MKINLFVCLLIGLLLKWVFNKLFEVVKGNIKKVNYWSGLKKFIKKGRNFKKILNKFGFKRVLLEKDEFFLILMKFWFGLINVDLV